MVQVQSTWFPVIDRNPQTFVPNIFLARETDFQPATQRIFRSAQHASHILLPVVVAESSPRLSGDVGRANTRTGGRP